MGLDPRREIELFVKHVTEPVIRNGAGDVREYFRALVNEGLVGLSPDEIDAFFDGSEF